MTGSNSQQEMVSGVSRKGSIASNRRRARQTEPEPVEVNVPMEEDDHVDANNDYVDDDIGVEDDDVDNDIVVEADLMEDDVGVDDDNTEPVPGAPEDPSLLISFRNHVAVAVWKKKSGLSVLIDHTYRHDNRVAISAFVERWHLETNTFHMPDGEMTVTLDDVRTIFGIPVTGMALSCPKLTRYEAAELVNTTLGVPVNDAFAELVQSRGQSMKLEWLRIRFHECSVTRQNSFSQHYVAIQLENFNLLHNKVSGAHCEVSVQSHNSRAGVKQITGYLKLLEVWIYEHFRLGRPHSNLSYSDEQPCVCRRSSRRDRGFTEDHLQTLREQLDMLHANEIEWDPYCLCRTHHPLHEVAYYTRCLKCFDIVEPYHPNRVLRQFGRVITIPPEPLSPVRAIRGSKPGQYRIMYQYHDTIWAQWENHVLSINARSVLVQQRPSECCNDAVFNVDAAVHRLSRDESVLHPDVLYETIGRMLQVLDGQSLGSTST
ncbi:protein MAIN-LIKE 1-like, partial [Camellia sinensis]|uniref:protein MAIN-LIKE 1-like n=1 Tax=Camellia sinensis TaxID=4442 RepID=UPI001035E3A6